MVKYSDKLLNAIPVCPEYAKLEVIVEKIAEATGEPVGRVREGVKKALRRFIERGVVVRHPQLGGYYCRKDVKHNVMELEETLNRVDGGVDCIYDVKPPVVKVVFIHVKNGENRAEAVSRADDRYDSTAMGEAEGEVPLR